MSVREIAIQGKDDDGPIIGPTEPACVARILAVDDVEANLVALRAILEPLGQPVECVRSGTEALRLLLRNDYAIILMDVMMPGLDGYETAAMIRGRERSRHIPIIFLSAVNKEQAHMFRGYAAGAVDYVFKPVEPEILRSKVSVFIELHKKAEKIRAQAEHEKQLMAENLKVRAEKVETAAELQRSLASQSLIIQSLPMVLYACQSTGSDEPRVIVGGDLQRIAPGATDCPHRFDDWFDRIHQADRAMVAKRLAETPEGSLFAAEYRWRRDDGSYTWLSDRAMIATRRQVRAGGASPVAGMLLDVSERKALEEKLLHAQKLEAVGQMTGGIAHDFNNMLGVIIGSLDRALPLAAGDPKLSGRIDLAMQAATSCADLTKRLLTFARRQELEPRVVDLGAELNRVRRILERIAGKSIAVSIRPAGEAWNVLLDPVQLEAAMVNLVVNARDAIAGGGSIALSVINHPRGAPGPAEIQPESRDFVELCVADDGPGMPENVRHRAFEPFFTTKEVGKGTGLGLSSVYGFITQSGGAVQIDSEPGAGTRIRMFLPRETRPAVPVPADPDRRQTAFAGWKVLVVEDDLPMQQVAKSLLKGLGCSVTCADNAAAALAALQSGGRFDLLFSDCVMPGEMDGVQLAGHVMREHPGMPVLLTSGFRGHLKSCTDVLDRAHFIAKPYDMEQLRQALSRIAPQDPTVISQE